MRLEARLVAAVGLLSACQKPKSAGDQEAFAPLDVGTPVPSYSIPSLAGDTVKLGGARGATVLNVWATWCTSCREEMASLDSLNREFGPRGVRVIGVSVDEGSTALVRRFAEANHLKFTIAHDSTAEIQRTYRVVGVPTTFVIGADGKLLWQYTGNISDAFDKAHQAVAKAVGG